MRTFFLAFLALSVIYQPLIGKASTLRLSGPLLVESVPLLVMAQQSKRGWTQGFDVQFTPWHSPDMLRAMVAGDQIDAAIVTTATASTLYAKGVNCRVSLLHISPIWIVSTQPGPNTLESLKGVLLFPFGPGEMPELLFKATIAEKSTAITTRHTGGPLEAFNLLLAGKGNHALLSEPLATIALKRSRMIQPQSTPLLVKRVDMRDAWGRTFPGHKLVTSSVTFFGSKADNPALMKAFNAAYIQALQWIKESPRDALKLVKKSFPSLALQMEQWNLEENDTQIISGESARREALFFLGRINEISPAATGGSLPNMDFFEVD